MRPRTAVARRLPAFHRPFLTILAREQEAERATARAAAEARQAKLQEEAEVARAREAEAARAQAEEEARQAAARREELRKFEAAQEALRQVRSCHRRDSGVDT